MSTLLLRLAGPLQSWGLDSKFDRRNTRREPTKSAVIGLLAAALGRRRDESLSDLSEHLRFGVRVDNEGDLLRDYHTAKSEKSAYVTQRYYLCDAVFLVGLQGEDPLLLELTHALSHPAFPLFLGRRSCPPEGKLVLGIVEGASLEEALSAAPRLLTSANMRKNTQGIKLRLILTAQGDNREGYFQRDEPLSFDQKRREYGFRRITETWIALPGDNEYDTQSNLSFTQHDAYSQLEG